MPFWEGGTTFPTVTPGRFSIPAWLTCTSQVPTLDIQRTPAKSQHEMEGAAFPMLHCPVQTPSDIQEPQDSSSPACESLLPSWPASFGGQRAPDPVREQMWPLHRGGDKVNRADESRQSSQGAPLKHRQVLSFPSCVN